MNPDIVDNALAYIRQLFASDCSGHDVFHTLRVYRTATLLAQAEQADLLTVQLAALLHDADDRKLSLETWENKDRARAFLRSQGMDEENIHRILHIISQVSFEGTDSVIPDTIEGRCVQDADRLDAIGAMGVARAFAYGGSHGTPIYDPDILPLADMDAQTYRTHKSTSVNHFYEKLLLLKDMMTTPTGARLAEHRDAYMRSFLAEFMAEWSGEH